VAAPVVEPEPSAIRGKYLVLVGGCNDCHTPGYSVPGARVPESQWLVGVPLGWRGPWGTTYAGNLRLFVNGISEDEWVKQMHVRAIMPPMPWASLQAMTEGDLRSVYRYVKGLGVSGEAMPKYLPPGVEPGTVYLDLRVKDGKGNQ
jgi:mono/diheme cytochrome c family protein